jgi:hypothetical protein
LVPPSLGMRIQMTVPKRTACVRPSSALATVARPGWGRRKRSCGVIFTEEEEEEWRE